MGFGFGDFAGGLAFKPIKNALSGGGGQGLNHQRQVDNYTGAQGLTANYTPTSADQVQNYMNPYTDQVVDQSMQDADRYRQMMVNQTGDAAQAAGAFGGSRHGVAEALTNQGAMQQFGLLSSQLRQQGYGQALGAAQQENQYGYQYPLARQGLLDEALSLIRKKNPNGVLGAAGQILGGVGGLAQGAAAFGAA